MAPFFPRRMAMEEQLSDRWSHCKQTLQNKLSAEDAAAWLSPLELVYLGPEKAILEGVPNTFFRSRIQSRFGRLIRECLSEAFPGVEMGEGFPLEIRVGGPQPSSEPGKRRSGAVPATTTPPSGEPIPNVESHHHRFGFATFLEGPHNQDALHLARQVAQAPGGKYNPLFLVGAVGVGKTHLLRAIAHQLNEHFGETHVIYRTAEAFANEVIDGIQRKKMAQVRAAYRKADALLIDDVEFLGVSGKSQMELLHTFDALHAGGKQLVFSGNRFPSELKELEPTLRSRLEGGLSVDLHPPDEAGRVALIKAWALREGLPLPGESAELLAQRIRNGGRRLEGALVRLSAYGSLHGEGLGPAFVESVAAPFFDPESAPVGMALPAERILGVVCDRFGISMKVLRSRKRTKMLGGARRIAVYLLREHGGLSFPEIGAVLGNRAYSTMSEAHQGFRETLDQEPNARSLVANLEKTLREESA